MSIEKNKLMMRKLFGISIIVQLICMMSFSFMISTVNKGEPIGSEFLVNTYTTNHQWLPSVALDSVGNFIITWQSNEQDGELGGIYAQRYASDGSRIGNEFRVNNYTANRQESPWVSMTPNGSFVIAWESYDQDGDGCGIFAQRYHPNGTILQPEFQVNTHWGLNQLYPCIAINPDGNFVIVWVSSQQDGSSYGIFAQRYDKNGNPSGDEFQVNTYTDGVQSTPSAAMDSDGNFVIAWAGTTSLDNYGVVLQSYDRNGTALGGEVLVNTYTTDLQDYPTIAMNSTGHFVIAWQSMEQDGDRTGIYAQRFDNNANPVGSEFHVSTYTTSFQSWPSAAMNSEGDFVITWSSDGQDGDGYGAYAQRYNRTGNTIGTEFRVNNYTTNDQSEAEVAMNAEGYYVVTWYSSEQDGDGYGVYAQRYCFTTELRISDIDVQNISQNSVIITWTTNIPANSSVDYGLTNGYGSNVQTSSEVTMHNIELTGLEPGRLYHFRVIACNDSVNYSISKDFTFTTKFPINLGPGWNMVSVPLNQTDCNLRKVLENISGNYDAVQWFDVSDLVDPWKHNHTSKPFTLNDLTDVDRHMGLWIHITNLLGTTLYVNGTAPEIGYVNQITLHNGWNLVGYPSLIEREPGFSGLPVEVDMVKWYNASSGLWKSWDPGASPDTLNLLKPGQGFWIHFTGVTDVWSLDYVN